MEIMSIVIFLDESGDLGWSFGAPYRKGGSSRHLTISAIKVPHDKHHLPGRLIKKMYQKFGWDSKLEKKWVFMTETEKLFFAGLAKKLILDHPLVQYLSITVYKPRVEEHIQRDPNKLYNYLIKILLLDEMAKYNEVRFYPDPRSIKVASGDSLHDYLQTELYFTKEVKTKLITRPQDSASNKGVQFTDMLSGLVQQHFEDKNSKPFSILSENIHTFTRYFP